MASMSKNINKINQLIAQNIEDLIFICNENIECEYYNIEELQKETPLINFLHPDDSKRVVKFVEDVFQFGNGKEESRILGDNNFFIWYEIKGKRFLDDRNNRKVILICRDISKFKRLEKEIKDSQIRYAQLADTLPEIKYWKLLQSKESFMAIQKAREMLELIINNIPQLIYWKDIKMTYLGCNINFAAINGLINPPSIIGQSDDNLKWVLDKLDHIIECERNVIKNNEPEYNVIEFLETSDGKQAWYEINRIPLHDIRGKVVGVLVTYEDITIRKFSEQRLKESEEKYRTIFNSGPDYIYITDLEGNFLDMNLALLDRIGMTLEEVRGINIAQFYIGDNIEELLLVRDEIETGKEIKGLEIKARAKTGEILEYEVNSVPIKENGRVVKVINLARDITDKKLAEQKLKESELKYRNLFEKTPYSIILINRRGEIIDCNPATETVFNRKVEDLINKNFLDVSSKLKRFLPLFEQRYSSILEGVVPEPLEIQISRLSDERLIWISIDDSLVEIAGDIVFQVIIQDITEKKISEQKLKQSQEDLRFLNKELEQKVKERTKDLIKSERQYRTTIDSLGDPLHVVDRDLRIILVNNAFKSWLTELNIDAEIIGRKILEVFPFLLSKVYDEYKEVFDTGSHLITIETNTLQERVVITETRKIPIFNEGRVEQVITIIRNITESREMENQLKESEEKYRNMVNNLDVGFYKGEFQGKLLMHNQALNRIIGLNPEESVGGIESSQVFTNHETRKQYYKELAEKGYVRNFLAQIEKRNGEIITVDINAHVIYNSEGLPIEAEGTVADITEKFKLQQELLESEKKLREQNIELMKLDQVKNDFITMAAHELKTPLISISGYTDYILLKHRSFLTPEITEDLKTVQRNISRLEVLMDKLLEVMKIDENKLKLRKERVNVSKIINDCLDELSYLINEKNLEIILNINHEIMLNVDPTRIFTVFTNLISNAIKFTPDYGWIEITGKKIEDKYFFEVKDNGIGLAEDEIPRLFIKFERIKQPIPSRSINIKDSGTGLGLYITKELVNAHNGEIQASSEGLDKGTSFTFTLPI
ncbi:MAG: PAS domain S-box protein [Candidatus Lokiarchaeota archaeon]|nr:PAS domain S-box protein [Candidatus Lokiarchaeota archaeon]